MTKREFYSLKGGDVVEFMSGRIRTVIVGPADKGGHAIELPRHNRSWADTLTVTCFYHDIKHRLRGKVKTTRKLALGHELVRLKEIGVRDLSRRIRREALEKLRVCRAFDRPVCARLARLTAGN